MRLTLLAIPLLVACQKGDDSKEDVVPTEGSDTDVIDTDDTDTNTTDTDTTDTQTTDTQTTDTQTTDTSDTQTTDTSTTETGGTTSSCSYPAGSVEPMTEGEVLTPYEWPDARHMDGRLASLTLEDAPCDSDDDIDWSPHDVLVFVSIPAW